MYDLINLVHFLRASCDGYIQLLVIPSGYESKTFILLSNIFYFVKYSRRAFIYYVIFTEKGGWSILCSQQMSRMEAWKGKEELICLCKWKTRKCACFHPMNAWIRLKGLPTFPQCRTSFINWPWTLQTDLVKVNYMEKVNTYDNMRI